MIFAEMEYSKDYWDEHHDLVKLICSNFDNVKHGIQGDSWIWILEGEGKVAIDTFSSMKHQVKCETKSLPLVEKVIGVLEQNYTVLEYEIPMPEAHEDLCKG